MRALACLPREWLTAHSNRYRRWDADEALQSARRALPRYQQAFADDDAGDPGGPLFQAFTVEVLH